MVTINLNNHWRFNLGECANAWYKGYDDSHFREVMLPHDWSVEQPFSMDYSSGTGYLAGGIGWYRLRFPLPEEYRGKQIRIVFDGVYKNSQVWCNSYYLGKRPSGYATFSYDLTPFACFGEEENQVSVKVTHTDLADSRWFTGSGITRKVTLVVEEKVCPAEYGTYFNTRHADEETAEVEVLHEIVNMWEKTVSAAIETILYAPDGSECLRMTGEAVLDPGGTGSMMLSGIIDFPRLWSPDTPYLYLMRTYYAINGGEPYLVQQERVGIRSIRFDSEQGFFLNGSMTHLKGVCIHHDGGCLGAAMTAEVWQRRLEALKDCGCNAIRCSHNPHMPELYDLCDIMGFLVMDEAFDEWENAKNKWSVGHNVYPPKHQGYYEDFPQWYEADLRSMVRRDRNHPSVILWSIGNEIDYPNDPYCHPMFDAMTGNNDANKPEAERLYDANRPGAERMIAIARDLVRIVKEEDPHRPATLASAFPELSSRIGLFELLDVVGYNYKEHLYGEDHRRFPEKPLLGSENSHSYEAWLAVKENPYICGQFLWTGIDYLGEAKGWPVHGSPAGILTVAGYKKPGYYRRKAFWTDYGDIPEGGRDSGQYDFTKYDFKKSGVKDAVLHVAARQDDGREEYWHPLQDSWNYEEGRAVIVKCFSNLPEVALYLNGEEVGRQKGYQEDGTYCFRLTYKPGILEAKGYDYAGNTAAVRELATTGEAAELECGLWKKVDVLTGVDWEEASGRTGYLYQLEMHLTDREGRIPVWDDRWVKITVSGAGELRGLENGNLADVTSYSSGRRRTFEGKLLAYIRRTDGGQIRIMAETDIPGSTYREIAIL